MIPAGGPPSAVVGRADGAPARGNGLIAILVARGLATEDLCLRALKECKHGEPLARALVRTGAVSERDLATALAEASHTPFVSLEPYPELSAPIDPAEARLSSRRMVDPVTASAARLLPPSLCLARRVVLLSARGEEGLLAMADPFDATALREARQRTGLALRRVTAEPAEIVAAVERAWSDAALSVLPSPGDAVRRAIAATAAVGVAVGLGFLIAMRESLDLEHAFAVLALACGLTFFVYAARYYVATAIVVGAVAFSASARWAALRGARRVLPAGVAAGIGSTAGRPDADGYRMLRADPTLPGGPASLRLPPERQPFVSVQVALYNERRVVDRLLQACTSFDYDRYEVIVADDSTDETVEILERWKGHPRVRVLHRPERRGFKGGALQEALKRMDPRTEYVLVFDADFVPPPDAIWHFLDHFGRIEGGAVPERVAAVQGYQWHMLNASENWITRAIRAEFSGSYVLERTAQELFGAMKMISGSVYMIRADVLRRLGWSTSITEDWELTIRLYLAGYQVLYTPYIQSPAECVSGIRQLIRQRMRWARGHTFNVRKYFFPVMRSPRIGWREKVEFLFYAPYYLQSVVLLFGTVSWILGVFLLDQDLPQWGEMLGWSLVVSNLLALPLMNLAGLVLEGSVRRDAGGLLGSIALSLILVPFQAWAALCGLLDPAEGGWSRTPKSGRITEAVARLRLPHGLPWALPRRAFPASAHLTFVAVTAAVGILTVGVLSLRAAAASGAGDGDEILVGALGTAVPLGGLVVGWRRLRRRAAVALIACCVALSANVVFLANTIPADATAGNSDTFVFVRTSAFDPPDLDMTQGYSPAGSAATCPTANGSAWTCAWSSDAFSLGQTLAGGSATVDLYAANPVATIAFRAASTVNFNTSFCTIPRPVGLVSGDAMVAACAVRGGTGVAITAPAGWTPIRRTDNGTTLALATYWKVADPVEPASYVWTLGASAKGAGAIAAYSGVDTGAPVHVEDGQTTANASAHAAPSVTTSLDSTVLVTWHAAAVRATWTPPGGMTERADVTSASGGASSNASLEVNELAQGSAGSTGVQTATASASAVGVTQTVALRPAERSCALTVDLEHVTLADVITPVGSGTATVSGPGPVGLVSATFAALPLVFADGDRLRVRVTAPSAPASCNTRVHFDGAGAPSRLVTATIVPEALLPLLLLAPAVPALARRLGVRRRGAR